MFLCLCFVVVEEIVETTEQDLMNMYGQSQPCAVIQRNGSHERPFESPAHCNSSDEVKCSPPIKKHCSNGVLSECEPNISFYNEPFVEKRNLPFEDASFPSSPHAHKVQTSSPVKSPERNSPVKSLERNCPPKSSVRSANKENSALDDSSSVSPTGRTDCIDQAQIGDECSSKSPAKRKNIFAVSSNVGLRPRFSLNASKHTQKEVETKVEVRSR